MQTYKAKIHINFYSLARIICLSIVSVACLAYLYTFANYLIPNIFVKLITTAGSGLCLFLIFNYCFRIGHLTLPSQKTGLVAVLIILFWVFYGCCITSCQENSRFINPLQYILSWSKILYVPRFLSSMFQLISTGYSTNVEGKNSLLFSGALSFVPWALELIVFLVIIYIRNKRIQKLPYAYSLQKWFQCYELQKHFALIDFNDVFLNELCTSPTETLQKCILTGNDARFFIVELYFEEKEEFAYLTIIKTVYSRFNTKSKDHFMVLNNIEITKEHGLALQKQFDFKKVKTVILKDVK